MNQLSGPLGHQLVEIMGHQRLAGFVEPVGLGSAVLLRVTMPAGEPEERVLIEGCWINSQWCGPGTKVREERLAVDQYLGAASIFRMTATTEEVALRVQPRRVEILELVSAPQLGRGFELVDQAAQDEDDDDEDPHGSAVGL